MTVFTQAATSDAANAGAVREFTIEPDVKSCAALLAPKPQPLYHSRMFENLSQFDFHHRLAELQGPTLVFFTSQDCGSCRHLKSILTSVRQLNPDWHVFEVDAQIEMGLTREFEIFHLPALFLFANGEFHSELRCEATPGAIHRAVLDALREPAQEAP